MTEITAPTPLAGSASRVRSRLWIIGWGVMSRALILVVAAAVHFIGPAGFTRTDERVHLFGLLGAWDGRWYRIVATHGYLLEPGRQSDPAFFPLFPLMLRGLHALGIGYLAGGLVISNVSFLAALVAFEQLTRRLFSAQLARRATIYLALFPIGYVYSMSYPESLVLLAISLAALAAMSNRWRTAAALLAAGALARPETLFVALALLPLAVRAPSHDRGFAVGAILAPVAALASFALYLGLRLHDPLAWTHAERAWGRRFTPLGLLRAVQDLPRAFAGHPWIVRDVVFFVIYLGLLAAARHAGAPRTWVAAGAAVVIIPTFSGSFTSDARFGLLAPALFWGLAAIGTSRRRDIVIRVASVVLLAAGVATIPLVFP
jgi:Mannosyltransferase (PIG-V)